MKMKTISIPNSSSIKQLYIPLFIIAVGGGLVWSIITLTGILGQTTLSSNQAAANNAITFDQPTIDKLDTLKTSAENSSEQTLPTGRINPFAEN